MTFNFENLGAINHGEIELASLTVVCGKNNTGKTYLTYAIYGFLQNWRAYIDFRLPELRRPIRDVPISIDLEQIYKNLHDTIENAASRYTSQLASVLGGPESRFETTSIKIDLPVSADFLKHPFSTTISFANQRSFVALEKKQEDSLLTIAVATEMASSLNTASLRRIVTDALYDLVLRPTLPRAFIVSTERTGAVTFRSELNLTKNRLIEAAHQIKAEDHRNPMMLWEILQSSSYPLPVRDNVDFLNAIANVTASDSFLATEDPLLLEEFADLIGGDYRVEKQTGELTFQPNSAKGVKLSMGSSSSAVRSLVMLGLYLRHVAAKGDLLMIDEPELNLHPANQRRLARLIARLSNLGIRVFITTHSDYIVRELNNLIVLKGLGEKARPILGTYKYQDSDTLESEGVRLYTLERSRFRGPSDQRMPKAERVKINKATITQTDGIDSTTFDETIAEMNDVLAAIISADEESTLGSD